ncbi:hypothetical protein DMENIID0001_153190 [Sergentomyia squamirostris]
MKYSTVVFIAILALLPILAEGFFLRPPDNADPHNKQFDVFLQELVKFKIRLIKNVVYPILVEVPWKKIFEPEKYHRDQMNVKKINFTTTEENPQNSTRKVERISTEDHPFGSGFPTEDMIRMSSEPEDQQIVWDDIEDVDEVEILKLIPMIVEELKRDQVTREEKIMLRNIYGEIWPLVEEEARRSNQRAMHPILRAIFNSRELQMTSLARSRRSQATSNDYHWNSLSLIDHGPRNIPRRKRHNPKADFSTRLMDTVAFLVRESLRGNLKGPRRERKIKKIPIQKDPMADYKYTAYQVVKEEHAKNDQQIENPPKIIPATEHFFFSPAKMF